MLQGKTGLHLRTALCGGLDGNAAGIIRVEPASVEEERWALMDHSQLLGIVLVQQRNERHAGGGPRLDREFGGMDAGLDLRNRIFCEQVALPLGRLALQDSERAASFLDLVGDLTPPALQIAQKSEESGLLLGTVHCIQA